MKCAKVKFVATTTFRTYKAISGKLQNNCIAFSIVLNNLIFIIKLWMCSV